MHKIALVTGAEGFIGSHLTRLLHERGWRVNGTYLYEGAEDLPQLPRFTSMQCDIRSGQRVARVIKEVQPTAVFHLAAQSLPTRSWEDPTFTMECNVIGSVNLLEALRNMKRSPVVVTACSSAEYGFVDPKRIPVTEMQPLLPLHPYGISKVCLDLLARQYFLNFGLRAIRLRLFNTTGPGKTNDAPSDFVRQIVRVKKGLQDPLLQVGNLKPRRAFLDVRDTAEAFIAAAERGTAGEVYNVCGYRTYTMREILERGIALAGVKARIQTASRLLRPADEKIIFGSTSKFRKDTGWKPKLPIEQTLKSMLEYWERKL